MSRFDPTQSSPTWELANLDKRERHDTADESWTPDHFGGAGMAWFITKALPPSDMLLEAYSKHGEEYLRRLIERDVAIENANMDLEDAPSSKSVLHRTRSLVKVTEHARRISRASLERVLPFRAARKAGSRSSRPLEGKVPSQSQASLLALPPEMMQMIIAQIDDYPTLFALGLTCQDLWVETKRQIKQHLANLCGRWAGDRLVLLGWTTDKVPRGPNFTLTPEELDAVVPCTCPDDNGNPGHPAHDWNDGGDCSHSLWKYCSRYGKLAAKQTLELPCANDACFREIHNLRSSGRLGTRQAKQMLALAYPSFFLLFPNDTEYFFRSHSTKTFFSCSRFFRIFQQQQFGIKKAKYDRNWPGFDPDVNQRPDKVKTTANLALNAVGAYVEDNLVLPGGQQWYAGSGELAGANIDIVPEALLKDNINIEEWHKLSDNEIYDLPYAGHQAWSNHFLWPKEWRGPLVKKKRGTLTLKLSWQKIVS